MVCKLSSYWCNCFVKLVHTLANCRDRELVQNNPASTRPNKKELSREWTRSLISPSYWKSGQSRGFQRLENSRASRIDAILALARTPSCLWTSEVRIRREHIKRPLVECAQYRPRKSQGGKKDKTSAARRMYPQAIANSLVPLLVYVREGYT